MIWIGRARGTALSSPGGGGVSPRIAGLAAASASANWVRNCSTISSQGSLRNFGREQLISVPELVAGSAVAGPACW